MDNIYLVIIASMRTMTLLLIVSLAVSCPTLGHWWEDTLQKKRSFLLRICSVNMTKAAVSCGFGHIYWQNSYCKTSFSVQWQPHLPDFCHFGLSNSHVLNFNVFISLCKQYNTSLRLGVNKENGFSFFVLKSNIKI